MNTDLSWCHQECCGIYHRTVAGVINLNENLIHSTMSSMVPFNERCLNPPLWQERSTIEISVRASIRTSLISIKFYLSSIAFILFSLNRFPKEHTLVGIVDTHYTYFSTPFNRWHRLGCCVVTVLQKLYCIGKHSHLGQTIVIGSNNTIDRMNKDPKIGDPGFV